MRKALGPLIALLMVSLLVPVSVYSFNTRPLKGKIYGYVYDAETGEPIAGAIVGIVQTGDVTYTDENGYYEFNNVDPGTYVVGVVAEGYEPDMATVIVPLGQSVRHDFYLEPIGGEPEPSGIEGYVYDALTEEPIAGAKITVVELGETVYTDEKGYYHVDVPPGNYTVEASKEGYVTDTQNALVPPAKTVRLDFYLIPIPNDSAIIYGYVRDALTKQPINAAYIIVIDQLEYTRSRENGFYIIEVDEGTHLVLVIAPGYLPAVKRVTVEIGDVVRIDFNLVPLNLPIQPPISYKAEPIQVLI